MYGLRLFCRPIVWKREQLGLCMQKPKDLEHLSILKADF
jgi:hypothetical protein